MEIIKRVFGSIILNGLLTALFSMTAFYAGTFFGNGEPREIGIMGGTQMGLFIFGFNGLILGCILGLITGLLNQSGLVSAAISGTICIVLCFFLVSDPSKEESLSVLIFILIATILPALASGITGQVLNTPNSIK